MPGDVEVYNNLKKDIIRKTEGSYDLQRVKELFGSMIDSRRSLSRAKILNDIFYLLEEREVLNSNNVTALISFGTLLKNEDVINSVRGYKKLYLEDEDNVCVCGEPLTYVFPIINPERQDSVENNADDLEIAISNIAINIGKKWRVLTSQLLVPEHYIDEIREKYSNPSQQALKALNVWREYNGNAATLDKLTEALEARLCKMEGFGIHLLKPVITVD